MGKKLEQITPELQSFIEDQKLFKKVTDVAINPKRTKSDVKSILKLYNKEFSQTNKAYVLEKIIH